MKLLDMGHIIAASSIEMELSNPPPETLDNEANALWAKEKFENFIAKVAKGS